MNDIFYHIFSSGLKIVHKKTTSQVSYVGIMVGVGTRDELPEENGMAHYIEHCVFKGTQSLNSQQIIHCLEDVGAEINAYTTKEETVFYAATPQRYFERALSLITDLVLHPTFPKEETEKELSVILDEIESYNDSPSELIYDDFEHLVFKGHSLSMPILGTKKTLRQISKSPSIPKKWMKEHYLPSRMVVFSQGNLSFNKVVRLVEKFFDADYLSQPCVLPTSNSQFSLSAVPLESDIFHKHTHQDHIMIGGLAYPIGHKQQLNLYLLNNILGGGSLTSRLNLALREKKGLVYTVESQYTPLSDTGYWNIYLACDPKNKEQCLLSAQDELDCLREQRLTASQLKRALRQLRGQMAIAAENQENNVLSMAKQMLYHGHACTWRDTYQKIANTTAEELQYVAQEIYQTSNCCILRYE